MKRFLFVVLAVFAIATLARTAGAVNVGDFPEKGWHKGPYLAATVGMMQVTNDRIRSPMKNLTDRSTQHLDWFSVGI